MVTKTQEKENNKLSVLFLARPSTASHSLLHALGQEDLTIELQLLTKSQYPLLRIQKHDLVVVDVDTDKGDDDLTAAFIQDVQPLGMIAVISHETADNRLKALSYGAQLLYSTNADIVEMKLMLSNLISRQRRLYYTPTLISPFQHKNQMLTSFACQVGEDWYYYHRGNVIYHCKEQREVCLTKQEGIVLRTLISHQGDYVDRDRLFQSLGNRDWHYNDRTIDVLVSRLRKKIAQISPNNNVLQTGYGQGYRLRSLSLTV